MHGQHAGRMECMLQQPTHLQCLQGEAHQLAAVRGCEELVFGCVGAEQGQLALLAGGRMGIRAAAPDQHRSSAVHDQVLHRARAMAPSFSLEERNSKGLGQAYERVELA